MLRIDCRCSGKLQVKLGVLLCHNPPFTAARFGQVAQNVVHRVSWWRCSVNRETEDEMSQSC